MKKVSLFALICILAVSFAQAMPEPAKRNGFSNMTVVTEYSELLKEKNARNDSLLPALDGDKAFAEVLRLNPNFWSLGGALDKEASLVTKLNAKVVFIGPCTAKKMEVQLDTVKPYVDSALTFEELQALFDSRDIDLNTLEEGVLDNASYFGRIFARCGGLADAVAEGLKEQGLDDFELNAVSCDGIEECKKTLTMKSKNLLKANFIEGMACVGGCIGGAGCLTHGAKDKMQVDKYGQEAMEKTILDAISILK